MWIVLLSTNFALSLEKRRKNVTPLSAKIMEGKLVLLASALRCQLSFQQTLESNTESRFAGTHQIARVHSAN